MHALRFNACLQRNLLLLLSLRVVRLLYLLPYLLVSLLLALHEHLHSLPVDVLLELELFVFLLLLVQLAVYLLAELGLGFVEAVLIKLLLLLLVLILDDPVFCSLRLSIKLLLLLSVDRAQRRFPPLR